MESESFKKILSSYALNDREEQELNLVHSIYLHVCTILCEAISIFTFIAELFSFSKRLMNFGITC